MFTFQKIPCPRKKTNIVERLKLIGSRNPKYLIRLSFFFCCHWELTAEKTHIRCLMISFYILQVESTAMQFTRLCYSFFKNKLIQWKAYTLWLNVETTCCLLIQNLLWYHIRKYTHLDLYTTYNVTFNIFGSSDQITHHTYVLTIYKVHKMWDASPKKKVLSCREKWIFAHFKIKREWFIKTL